MLTIKYNPDVLHVKKVRKALKENDGYCPCAISKNADTKCMCKEFREQYKKGVTGKCHCGLYEVVTIDDYTDELMKK